MQQNPFVSQVGQLSISLTYYFRQKDPSKDLIVKASHRTIRIIASLPPSTAKALRPGCTQTSKAQPACFKSFLSNRSSSNPDQPSSKASGPQRVAAGKPPPFHPYPGGDVPPQRKLGRVELGKSASKTFRSATTHIASTPSLPAISSSDSRPPSKIVSSTSSGNMPVVKTLPQSFAQPQVQQPTISSTPSIVVSPRRSATIESVSVPVTAKSIFSDFLRDVRSIEWDARYKALVGFIEIMDRVDVLEFIKSSKSNINRLSDVFMAGLVDVHFKVVSASLDFGSKLIFHIPANLHPEPTMFASTTLIRLCAAATKVQFRAKTSLIEATYKMVLDMSEWVAPECLCDTFLLAAHRAEATLYSKSKCALFERLSIIINSLDIIKVESHEGSNI